MKKDIINKKKFAKLIWNFTKISCFAKSSNCCFAVLKVLSFTPGLRNSFWFRKLWSIFRIWFEGKVNLKGEGDIVEWMAFMQCNFLVDTSLTFLVAHLWQQLSISLQADFKNSSSVQWNREFTKQVLGQRRRTPLLSEKT